LAALGQVFGTSDPDEVRAVNCSYRAGRYTHCGVLSVIGILQQLSN